MRRNRKNCSNAKCNEKEHAMKKDTHHDINFDYPELDSMDDNEFYRIYKVNMYSVAWNENMDKGEADLAISNVMQTIFMKHACHYNPAKGRFTNYLATMVRNACRSLRRGERRYVNCDEDELVRVCEENGATTRVSEYLPGEISQFIDEAIRILRKEVHSQLMVDAFVMMVLEGERPIEVARKLNVRPDYVSLAKNRCLPRLRAILRKLMDED